MLLLHRAFAPLLIVVALLSVARPAVAGDSETDVFVGELNLGASAVEPDAKGRQPLAVLFHDERSPAGDSRQDTVSIFYANRIYTGTQITLSPNFKVTLKNVEEPHDVLFRGTLQVLDAVTSAILDGQFTSADKKTRHIHVKLRGYEIPYSATPTAD